MKKLLIIIIALVSISYLSFSQSPQTFNYQAVVRDAAGDVIVTQNVSIRIEILQTSSSGTSVYSEEHSVTTNLFGLVNLQIGGGTPLSGDFATIDWGADIYFLQIELDETGGTAYQLMGNSQLISVPYSLYANEAGNVIYSDTSATNELQDWATLPGIPVDFSDNIDNVDDADADPNNEIQVLSINADTLFLSNGNFVIMPDNVNDADADPANELQDWATLPGIPIDFSDNIDNVDDADTDPNNEIQVLSINADTLFLSNGNFIIMPDNVNDADADPANELQDWATLPGIPVDFSDNIDNVDDADIDPNNEIQTLSLSNDSVYLSNGNSVYLNTLSDTSYWEKTGNDLYYDIGNVGVGTVTPNGRLQVNSDVSAGINDVIFSVLNANGDTVFAVYQEGVRIWVDDNGGTKANGSRGGFAVGGFNPTKAGFTNEYLRVTPDSVRIYIDDDYVAAKANGSRGGFAVGGFNPTKGTATDNYLFVQDDSTRVYVADSMQGFGVENIESANNQRIMKLTTDNYLIGHESGINLSGEYNSFYGYETGKNSTSANKNVFIGFKAGYNNTTGHFNNFIGYKAGYNNTTGYNNIFVGHEAGHDNTTGLFNTFVGSSAGYSNLDGGFNSLYGVNSGGLALLGTQNAFYGNSSGCKADSTGWCVMLGAHSGYFADKSNASIFIGNMSGYRADSSIHSVALGYQSNYNANNTTRCVNVGYMSGYDADSSSYSVSIGAYSGYKNNTGANVFIGSYAGYDNTTGSSNVFMGYYAGHDNIDGEYNNFIGRGAGNMNISGDRNNFLGHYAGYNTTTGSSNNFIGDEAGLSNTDGFSNNFVGFWAGYNNTSGNNNNFIGRSAGYNTTTGYYNNFIGYGTGHNNTVGHSNTIIGNFAGHDNVSGNSNVFLGSNAGYNETSSDKLYIENSTTSSPLIGGDFAADRIGINRMPTTYTLEVGGTIWANGASITAGATTWSDVRYKTNINTLENALDKICDLRGVTYDWRYSEFPDKNFPNGLQIGVIAQEVEIIFPELVNTDNDGYKSVSYEKLTPILIEAIKEQQKEIEQLKKDKAETAELNSDLLNRLEKVEAKLNNTAEK